MRGPGLQSPSVPIGAGPRPLSGLAEEVLATYIAWRKHAPMVAGAYERWLSASPADRSEHFAAYTAELDREEAAAGTYAKAILELERWPARR